uniref:Sigma non-opioid intracellular receptor 1 n=1 Tax=Parascaris univalens TaxID=6257 RepID=A0A914ZQW7_PARUN
MAFFFTKTVRYIIFAIVLYSATQYFLRWKSYTFSPKEFRRLSGAAHGANGLSNVNKLRNDLRRSYQQHIIDSGWEAAYGGGLSLRLNFLHASPTEFIVVFHAPHRTVGFSGWHWANTTCTVLNGEVSRLAFSANGGNKEIFKIGNNFRHGEFERYTYELAEESFVVCYGRGATLLSSVWLATGALGSADPVSFARLTLAYMQGSIHEIGMAVTNTFHYYKAKALKTEL